MPKPARFGTLPAVVALLAIVTLAACGSAEPSSPPATILDTLTPSIGASNTPPSSVSPGVTEPPSSSTPSEEPPQTESPTVPPTQSAPATASSPPESSATPTVAPGVADECTASKPENRDFFVKVADAVSWPVLCAVLPPHWLLLNGTYHLARGGEMAVDYGGPGTAALNLQQGAFCANSGGCVPAGTEKGDAALGPLAGTLVALDDGGFAVVVDRGASPSWLMVVHGVDQASAVSIGAAMVQVGS